MIKSSKGERKEKNTEVREKYISACGGVNPELRPMLDPDGNPIIEEEDEEDKEED